MLKATTAMIRRSQVMALGLISVSAIAMRIEAAAIPDRAIHKAIGAIQFVLVSNFLPRLLSRNWYI